MQKVRLQHLSKMVYSIVTTIMHNRTCLNTLVSIEKRKKLNIYVNIVRNKWQNTKSAIVQDTDGIWAPVSFSAGANGVTNRDKSF